MPSNWLVPMTPEEVAEQAAQFTSAQIDPLLAAIAQQQRRGTRAIKRYTNQSARRLRPLARQTRRDYRMAAGRTAAVSDVLGSIIQGGAGAGSLADALHGISGQGGRAAGARAFAQGAGGAAAGMGASAIEQLTSQGASETAYARKLPAFQRLEGARGISDLNSAAMSEASRIRASAPGIYQEILDRLRGEQIGLAQENRARQDVRREGGSRGLSPGEVQSAREAAFGAGVGLAQDLFQQQVTTTDKFGKERTSIRQVPYDEALRRVSALISSTLQGILSPAEVRSLAAQALVTAGYGASAPAQPQSFPMGIAGNLNLGTSLAGLLGAGTGVSGHLAR